MVLALLVGLWGAPAARAQEETRATEGEPRPGGTSPSGQEGDAAPAASLLVHRLELTSAWFVRAPAPGTDRLFAELDYRPRWTPQVARRLRMVVEPLIRAAASRTTGSAPDRFSALPERQALLVKEALVRWEGELADVTAGWQLYGWGRSDGVHPLNVFELTDETDRLRAEQLGIPSLSVTAASERWMVEGAWVPLRVYSHVPYDPRNPWGLGSRAPGAVARHTTPAELEPELGEVGVRVGYSGDTGDVALLAARSRDHLPTSITVTPELGAGGAATLVLTPTFARFWVVGATGALPLGPYLARLDAGYFFYEHDRIVFQRSGVRAVAGLERQWSMPRLRSSARLILQYALDQTAPERFELVGGRCPSPFRPYRQAAMGNLSLSVGERFSAETKALVDVVSGAWIWSTTFTFRRSDSWSAWAGADVIDGPHRSTIGQLAGTRRALIGLKFLAR